MHMYFAWNNCKWGGRGEEREWKQNSTIILRLDIQEKNILQDIHLISDTCFLHGIITNGQAKFYNNPKTEHIGYKNISASILLGNYTLFNICTEIEHNNNLIYTGNLSTTTFGNR